MVLVMNGMPVQASESSHNGLAKAFAILEGSPIGKKLLDEAKEKDLSIIEGKISKTEIIATRVMESNREKLEFHVQVLISKDKNPVFQAIDLAHELVHALHPKSNPFDPKLNAVDYIREGIEAEGGEAHAILQECKVGHELVELVQQEQAQLIKARCQFVWNSEKNEEQWNRSFYHLGRYLSLFRTRLGTVSADQDKNQEISRLAQAKDPMFSSAAANKPYPLALLDEYVEITRKICNHSQKRKIEVAGNNPMEERCQSLSSALFSP